MPAARAFVRHALRQTRLANESVERIVLAAAEACNNAILHATGDVFAVSVVVDGDHCSITVSDSGCGFRPPDTPVMPSPENTGQRGLALMEMLVDRVHVASTPQGTVVVLTHPVPSAGPRVAADR
ncbi:MAG TPA: ATP-binding protein [Acidimicrobiales bacterium]|nr:ATP-binding protein [Acidimicrobiales bacterium]